MGIDPDLEQRAFEKLLITEPLEVLFKWIDEKIKEACEEPEEEYVGFLNQLAQSCIKQKNERVLRCLINQIKGTGNKRSFVSLYLDPSLLTDALESVECFKLLWPYFMAPLSNGVGAIKEAASHGKYEILMYLKEVCKQEWASKCNDSILAGLCNPEKGRAWNSLDEQWFTACITESKRDMNQWEKTHPKLLGLGFVGGRVEILEKLKAHGCHFKEEKLCVGFENKKSKMACGSFEGFLWGLENIPLEPWEYPILIRRVLFESTESYQQKKIRYWLEKNMALFGTQDAALDMFNTAYFLILKHAQDKNQGEALLRDFVGNWLDQLTDKKAMDVFSVLEKIDEKNDLTKEQWQNLFMQSTKGPENIRKLAARAEGINKDNFKNKALASAVMELVSSEHTLMALAKVVDSVSGTDNKASSIRAIKRGL